MSSKLWTGGLFNLPLQYETAEMGCNIGVVHQINSLEFMVQLKYCFNWTDDRVAFIIYIWCNYVVLLYILHGISYF